MAYNYLMLQDTIDRRQTTSRKAKPIVMIKDIITSFNTTKLISRLNQFINRLGRQYAITFFCHSFVGQHVNIVAHVGYRCPQPSLRTKQDSIGSNYIVCHVSCGNDSIWIIVTLRNPLALIIASIQCSQILVIGERPSSKSWNFCLVCCQIYQNILTSVNVVPKFADLLHYCTDYSIVKV